MSKSLEQLSAIANEMLDNKHEAKRTGSEGAAQQAFEKARQLLSTGKEFAPEFRRTDKDGLQKEMNWLEREVK